jgi:hypothetical protein
LLASACTAPQREDIDPDVDNISEFLMELIQTYDISGITTNIKGIGAIPTDKYPSFLSDVFLAGNAASNAYVPVDDETKQLLLESTTGFTSKYNTTEVGIQEFYMDLVKDYTIYLTENEEKYSKILEIFFTDTPQAQETDISPERAGESA